VRAFFQRVSRALAVLEDPSAPPPLPLELGALEPASIKGVIRLGTPAATCFHEAGHGVIALALGARVLEMELILTGRRPSGHALLATTVDQRQLVAAGGLAAEYELWAQGRLTWFDGERPSAEAMSEGWARTAEDDRLIAFGDQRAPDGRWPKAVRQAFRSAVEDARAMLDFDLAERLARELLVRRRLREADVLAIARTHDAAEGA
jgi:hypothetical protein